MFFVIFVCISLTMAHARGCPAGRQMLRSGQLSTYEKQAIVDAHNKLRQSVALGQISRQPPAANMMEMKWDDELAATAQRWAEQCTTAHDGASQRDVGRFPVGQNIAATWTTKRPSSPADSEPDFNKQIKAWFDEVQVYWYKPTGYGHGTGHYSQLVWGETSQVGCGYSFYYDPSKGYTKLYVCNYGPGGNVIGSNPYEKGYPSCSSFGLSESRKYNGLCSGSYTASSSYETNNNFASNVIPESSADSHSGYNTFSYNAYRQYDNQFSNDYNNQYNNNNYNTQYQDNNQFQNSYQQPPQSYYSQPSYQHKETSTYKPLVSIFKSATNLLSGVKRNGLGFGNFYL